MTLNPLYHLQRSFCLKLAGGRGRLIYAWPGAVSYSVIQRPGLAHWGQIRGSGVRNGQSESLCGAGIDPYPMALS